MQVMRLLFDTLLNDRRSGLPVSCNAGKPLDRIVVPEARASPERYLWGPRKKKTSPRDENQFLKITL
jgi:hypothetical protein